MVTSLELYAQCILLAALKLERKKREKRLLLQLPVLRKNMRLCFGISGQAVLLRLIVAALISAVTSGCFQVKVQTEHASAFLANVKSPVVVRTQDISPLNKTLNSEDRLHLQKIVRAMQ